MIVAQASRKDAYRQLLTPAVRALQDRWGIARNDEAWGDLLDEFMADMERVGRSEAMRQFMHGIMRDCLPALDDRVATARSELKALNLQRRRLLRRISKGEV